MRNSELPLATQVRSDVAPRRLKAGWIATRFNWRAFRTLRNRRELELNRGDFMRAVAFLICAFMGALSAKAIAEDSTTATPREIAACGNNKLSMFQTWSRIAGKSTDKSALSKVSNAQVFSVSMRDGRTIRGLRVYSTQSSAPSAL